MVHIFKFPDFKIIDGFEIAEYSNNEFMSDLPLERNASYWSVFQHYKSPLHRRKDSPQGRDCLADCSTYADAVALKIHRYEVLEMMQPIYEVNKHLISNITSL